MRRPEIAVQHPIAIPPQVSPGQALPFPAKFMVRIFATFRGTGIPFAEPG